MNFKRAKLIFTAIGVIILITNGTIKAQENLNQMPHIVNKNGHYSLIVNGQPFFIMGGQAHNSSAWPGMMPGVWKAIETMHANTLEAPIYWEQIEAQQGNFNFSLIDTLLFQAREHNVHLVLLWFATWKNGSNHYMPEWMKLDSKKYPNILGKDGQPVDSPSPHNRIAMEADAKAFTAVMAYLKKADPQHTVIMVQVENEPGTWGSVRDFSPEAQKLFNGQVPNELLKPEILKELKKPVVTKGSWSEVFGTDADEYFHAWSVARYIEYVAAAGKAVNPLPLYVNAALRDPLTNPSATTYESGGPTDNVIPIWKAAAPAIDLLAPDIYLPESERALKVIERYDRADNPLFVPEIGLSPEFARYFYPVLASGGIGFSPFGVDDNGRGENEKETQDRLTSIAREYAIVGSMMKELIKWSSEGKIKSIIEREDHAIQTVNLGAWQAVVTFGMAKRNIITENEKPMGNLMIIKLGENDFLFIGALYHLTFNPTGQNAGKAWQFLKVEEGWYDDGEFKQLRVRNGDETDWGGPSIGPLQTVLHITLTTR